MESHKQPLDDIVNSIVYGVMAMPENHETMIKEELVFGKKVLKLDALTDKNLAKAYWLLDGNAFKDQPAPIFMKIDTLILGGCPIVMMLPKEKTDPELVKELEAEQLEHIPIGFIDLHKTAEGKFSASGLGIAKPYQGKGLSKYLIYGGVKIAGIQELYIPTQEGNKQALYAWAHLQLEKVYTNLFHNKEDTVIYKAKIPKPAEKILEKLKK